MWSRVGKAADVLKAVETAPITASEFYRVGIQKLWEQQGSRQRPGAEPFKIGKPRFRSAMYSILKLLKACV